MIIAFIDELRTEGHAVESIVGSCVSRTVRLPREPTATGHAVIDRLLPGRSLMRSSPTWSVIWRGGLIFTVCDG